MKAKQRKIRYAVVGLGYISQIAVLPAFKHAKNSELTALISGDPKKLKKMAKKYKVDFFGPYEDFENILRTAEVDVVYIATPNTHHKEFAQRAARMGVHVLCEKPMATTEEDCREMIASAEENGVKLMVAYRLHFEAANLEAIKIAHSGKLGEIRFFNSVFSMQVKKDNIRLNGGLGGGPTFDLGIYAINAARYLFKAEPLEVSAMTAFNEDDERFEEVEEMMTGTLRFPNQRLATFTASFGATDTGYFEIVGTKGRLRVDPAYDYAKPLRHTLVVNGRETRKVFPKRDQFAAELVYFSDCVAKNKVVEPSGLEGLCDVRIIRALFEAANTSQRVALPEMEKTRRPTIAQKKNLPPVKEPELYHAEEPSA